MNDLKWAKANSLGFLIADTARLLRKRFNQRARELGLTRAQWQVLAYLAMNEGINQAGLADLLEIEPITLSRHLARMEEAGLVVRRPDPNDKRARILLLSEQASGVLNEIRSVGRCVIDEITAGLTPAEIETMKNGLRHLRAALSERGGEAHSIEDDINQRRIVQ
jgi:MarR family transcriptional regulator, transcriptional regulator for hemolysin